MDRRQFLARTLAALPAATAYSATAASRWEEDIALLERAFTRLHPGLDRYLSESGIASEFERLKRRFAATDSLPDA